MNIDMEMLFKVVSEKSGITIEQARKAVPIVIEQLKAKLPPPLATEFEALLKEQPLAGVKM